MKQKRGVGGRRDKGYTRSLVSFRRAVGLRRRRQGIGGERRRRARGRFEEGQEPGGRQKWAASPRPLASPGQAGDAVGFRAGKRALGSTKPTRGDDGGADTRSAGAGPCRAARHRGHPVGAQERPWRGVGRAIWRPEPAPERRIRQRAGGDVARGSRAVRPGAPRGTSGRPSQSQRRPRGSVVRGS